ncbi:MAG: formamidopyrimidine-DNA glycosylase [Acidimicrobiia bacterium]|nr:formamidopyrimidine-DNA glycosylase [Acidimicrobiia bacterium]
MPELPDIEAYLAAMRPLIVGNRLDGVRVSSISLLKTFDPPLDEASGKAVTGLSRLGKRIVFELDDDLYLVLHLMVAGRLLWKEPGAKIPGKIGQAAFDFADGTLVLTEAGTKKRASLHHLRGEAALAEHDRGGIEVAAASPEEFAERLRSERHTLKRSLTDPRLFSGIGGAYSDEILHRARLSPLARSDRLSDDEVERLRQGVIDVMTEWTDRLISEAREGFPTGVTAFRPEMAVHGRFGEPCPDCGSPVQRIRYASNETNYCASCQTDGKVLADRAMSRLLKDDWPKSLDEL